MQDKKVDYGISDDYACLMIGNFMFYYGHEFTIPEVPDGEDMDDDIDYEWAFIVKCGKDVLCKCLPSDMTQYVSGYNAENFAMNKWVDPEEILLSGIGIVLSSPEFRKKIGFKLEDCIAELTGIK